MAVNVPDQTRSDLLSRLRVFGDRLVAASEELVFSGGLLLVAVGVSMVFVPAGVILTGLFLCLFSFGTMRS